MSPVLEFLEAMSHPRSHKTPPMQLQLHAYRPRVQIRPPRPWQQMENRPRALVTPTTGFRRLTMHMVKSPDSTTWELYRRNQT